MTIARAQMYRQLYQMGGIGTLPMDYGQSLQVNNQGQMPMPNYSSAQNITSNPLLNYGQPQLGASGGTPLTMRSGGISRLGYANGDVVNIEDQLMQQVQQPQQQMSQPAQPPLQGMEGQQPNIKDPKQALELIIQMLIAQGIPPEQAKEIAIQMVQAVAEGGMGEMEDQRIEARFGGSMRNGREQYGLGSIFKGVGKAVSGAVKGVTNAVKSVVSSPIGKAALAAAAIYATGGGALFGGPGFASAGTLFGPGGALGGAGGLLGGINAVEGSMFPGLLGVGGSFAPMSGTLLSGGLSSLLPSLSGNVIGSIAGGFLGGALGGGGPQREDYGSDEEHQQAVDRWKATLNTGLSNPTLSVGVNPADLYKNNPFYAQRRANGGRIGYGFGSLVSDTMVAQPVSNNLSANVRPLGLLYNPDGSYPTDSIKPIVGGSGFGGMLTKLIQQNPGLFSPVQSTPTSGNGITDLIKQTTKQTFFGNVKPMYDYNLQDLYNTRKENNDYMYANGGRIGYALGAEVPTRENQAGVKELDYRDTGGFVPPIGIKERADDIPAMLSNNEFVFTANAVRNAGGGNENLGAQRMYRLMKKLESGGRV